MSDLEYLHIWGQACWHDPVVIIGNTDALKTLKHAIESAIENGEHKVSAFFTSDREGFSLYVVCKDDNKWDNRAVPYSDEMAAEKNPNAIYPADEIKNK